MSKLFRKQSGQFRKISSGLFFVLILLGESGYAQQYRVGVPVCDTLAVFENYGVACDAAVDSLVLTLDDMLVPFVSGLNFQVEITDVQGIITSNVIDTLNNGDIIVMPTSNPGGVLKIFINGVSSTVSFIAKIAGTPTVANENYFCDIDVAITLLSCNNGGSFFPAGPDTCSVQPATAISEPSKIIKGYNLAGNYPNPFNPATTISYTIPATGFVQLNVYDVTGKFVRTLVKEQQLAGRYSLQFEGKDLPSGIYFYRLMVKDYEQTRRMVLLR